MPTILNSLCEACINAIYADELADGNFIQCTKDNGVKAQLEKGVKCEEFELDPED